MRAELTETEKDEVIVKYFKKHIMQKEIAKLYNVRIHVIQQVCQKYINSQKETLQFLAVNPLKEYSELDRQQLDKQSQNAIQWYDGLLTVGTYNHIIHEQFLRHL
mgnify:CR=1 FL=1